MKKSVGQSRVTLSPNRPGHRFEFGTIGSYFDFEDGMPLQKVFHGAAVLGFSYHDIIPRLKPHRPVMLGSVTERSIKKGAARSLHK
ncbi:MAG: hypothetical protein ACJA16_004963 [Akkermansiaceae bacterium]|jgi:hypothetical protein